MPWLAAAIGAVGAIGGGALQYFGQQNAADAQRDATNRSLQLQRDEWNQQQQNQAPWLAAGRTALGQLGALTANPQQINAMQDPGYSQINAVTNPGQFSFSTTGPNADPSYQWRLNQGIEALQKSAAARGGFFSGQTGEDIINYAQNAASQEYQNQFNRYQQQLADYMNQSSFNADQYNQAFNRQNIMDTNNFNRLSSLAGIGQTATNQLGMYGQNYSNNLSNMMMNQENNMANMYTNQGQILGNTLANVNNQFMSAWGQQQMLDAMRSPTQYPISVSDFS
jgi:hypothetical protein